MSPYRFGWTVCDYYLVYEVYISVYTDIMNFLTWSMKRQILFKKKYLIHKFARAGRTLLHLTEKTLNSGDF